jgi:hypothetical protein
MLKYSYYKICFIGAVCISILIIIASITIGSIGAKTYASIRHDQFIYKPTMCFVENYTIILGRCRRACYKELYTIIYNVSNGREIESTTIDTNGPGENSVSAMLESETMCI